MPELIALLLGVIPAALRTRRDLVLENLLLRHQLAVAARPKRRRHLGTWDKRSGSSGVGSAPTGAAISC
jgi:hypothetical protein